MPNADWHPYSPSPPILNSLSLQGLNHPDALQRVYDDSFNCIQPWGNGVVGWAQHGQSPSVGSWTPGQEAESRNLDLSSHHAGDLTNCETSQAQHHPMTVNPRMKCFRWPIILPTDSAQMAHPIPSCKFSFLFCWGRTQAAGPWLRQPAKKGKTSSPNPRHCPRASGSTQRSSLINHHQGQVNHKICTQADCRSNENLFRVKDTKNNWLVFIRST